jgi:hypothetical protein
MTVTSETFDAIAGVLAIAITIGGMTMMFSNIWTQK